MNPFDIRRYLRLPGRGRRTIAREIDAELAFHLEMRAAELRRDGSSESSAQREALRQFGDLADAQAYCAAMDAQADQRTRRAGWLDELRQDVRIALRQLRRSPAFTAGAVATLALGIGAATAVYSVTNAYLIRPLPYPDADRLAWVMPGPSRQFDPNGPSLDKVRWTALDTVFAATVSWDLDGFTLAGGERPAYVDGAWITPGYISALGVRVAAGRVFRPDEYTSAAPVAIISDRLWSERFGRDPSIIGKTVRAYSTDRPLEDATVTVVGVLPADAWHINRFTDVLRPLRGDRMSYIVRLPRGMSLAEGQARLDAIVKAQIPATDPSWHMTLRSLRAEYTNDVRPMLLAILGGAVFMLLITSASVAGVLVARAAGRRGELAVRAALGASRGRIIRQLLTESAVLALIASIGGVIIARLSLRAIAAGIGTTLGADVPGGVAQVAPDLGVLAMAIAVGVGIGLLFGVIPAMMSTRGRGVPLAGAGRSTAGSIGSAQLRRGLIAAQVALTMTLLVGAGLMARTVAALATEPLGFEPRGVARGHLLLPLAHYPDAASRRALADRLVGAMLADRRIQSAALAVPYPFRQAQATRIQGGADASAAAEAIEYSITPAYFDVLRIPVLGGRRFDARDGAHGAPVAIVSRDLAGKLWPSADAIGRRLRIGEDSVWRTVVGVVEPTSDGVGAEPRSDVYVPFAQAPRRYAAVLARTGGDAAALGTTLPRLVGGVDDVLALSDVQPMESVVARAGSRHRALATLLGIFATLALGLAVLGLSSSLSYVVAQRQRELAVRIAIGAEPGSIVRLVLGEGARTVAVGLVAGVLLSLAATRLLAGQLYGVGTTDPVTFAGIATVLALAALGAVAGPARRAGRVDPVVVLRNE